MKKKTTHYLPLFSIFVFLLVSCSVEKRLHTGGYFIKWHKNYSTSHEKMRADVTNEEAIPEVLSEITISETNQELSLNSPSDQTSGDISSDIEPTKNSSEFQKTTNIVPKQIQTPIKNVVGKSSRFLHKKKGEISKRADSELIINIVLTVLFLALTILFIFLAIPATGTMLYVWWALAAVSAILFVTQVIDLILW